MAVDIKTTANHPIVILGDCLELMAKMPPNSIELIVTDPPYFLDGMGANWDDLKLKERKKKAGVVGGLPTGMKFDREQGKALQIFFTKISEQMIRVLCPGGFCVVFSSPRLSHRMGISLDDAGFEIRDIYIWHYKNRSQQKAFSQDHFVRKMNISDGEKQHIIKLMGGRKTPQLRPQYEPMIIAQKPKEGTFVENWQKWGTGLVDINNTFLNGRTPTTVMVVDKPIRAEYNKHLTVKPIPLIETLIKLFSSEGQTILDPFVGSGTTLLAARNTERLSIGMEIIESYYEIALRRLKQDKYKS